MSEHYNNTIEPQLARSDWGLGKLIPILAALPLVSSLSTTTQYYENSFQDHPALGTYIHGV